MSQAALSAALRSGLLAAPASGALNNAGLTAFCDAFAAAFWPYLAMVAAAGIYLTPEGGIARQLVNGTGVASVAGSVVSASSVAGEFVLQSNEYDTIGIVYEDGIADGAACWVVFAGVADVLFSDTVAPVAGYWVYCDATDGRANNLAMPPGGTITAIDNHFKEIGHCIESASAGTDVKALCVVHFN